jgi:hypothetical protein
MKKLVVLLAVLAGTSAFAGESAQSEFFYQAPAAAHEGTFGLGFFTGEVDTSPSIDLSGQRVFAEYEYGINEAWAVGVLLNYTQTKIDTSPSTDSTGLNDLEINVKGKHTPEAGLRYGAMIELALQDGEVKSNGDTNQATGGIMVNPYVGYEMAKDQCKFGGKLARGVRLKDEKEEDKGSNTTEESSGGEATTLTGFYEHTFSEQWALGGSLEYAMIGDTKSDSGDTDNGNSMTLNVYAPMHMGPGTLIPQFSYASTSGADTDVTAMELSAKYRMTF